MTAAPFPAHIAPEAARRIRQRGGRLFLWTRPVGALAVDQIAFTDPPTDIVFACHFVGEIELCVAQDLGIRELIVRERRWPFKGVRIYVNGKRWGWRGEDLSASG